MQTVRSESAGTSSIETWACGCGRQRKIELRVAAALANADENETYWIERYAPQPVAEVLLSKWRLSTWPTLKECRTRIWVTL